MRTLIDFLLGCSHRRTTFPLTPGCRAMVPGPARQGTYVVCLDCGKEFGFDWGQMRITGPRPAECRGQAQTAEDAA